MISVSNLLFKLMQDLKKLGYREINYNTESDKDYADGINLGRNKDNKNCVGFVISEEVLDYLGHKKAMKYIIEKYNEWHDK